MSWSLSSCAKQTSVERALMRSLANNNNLTVCMVFSNLMNFLFGR